MLRWFALIAAVLGTACRGGSGSSCAPDWRVVYRHDAAGDSLAGAKTALLSAIRQGAPVRLAWGARIDRDDGTRSVEHTADPVFLTIAGGQHVVVQLPEHIGQRGYSDPTDPGFENPAVLWRGLMSTDGTFDAVWVDRATGEEVRRWPQRAGITWLAFLPAPSCEQGDPLELAVPGGVRRERP